MGSKRWASGFHIGPSVTFFTIASYYAALLFEGETIFHKVVSNAAFLVVACIGHPLKYLDVLLKNKKSAHKLAFGVYCTAKKVEWRERQWPSGYWLLHAISQSRGALSWHIRGEPIASSDRER